METHERGIQKFPYREVESETPPVSAWRGLNEHIDAAIEAEDIEHLANEENQ